jgi:vesicle coat complex subunit
MQTEDIEQKKLVYLYLINYAKTQPELVILAVNTFVKVRYSSVSYVLNKGAVLTRLHCHRTQATRTPSFEL